MALMKDIEAWLQEYGPADCDEVHADFSEYTKDQVRAALYNLSHLGRISSTEQRGRGKGNGRGCAKRKFFAVKKRAQPVQSRAVPSVFHLAGALP